MVPAPLIATTTYTRWVYLVVGGGVFMPYAIGAAVLVSLFLPGTWTDPTEQRELLNTAPVGLTSLLLALVLTTATGWLPGAHALQTQIARALLGGPITRDPAAAAPTTWRSRARTGVWLSLHLLTGFALSLATMILLTQAALLAAAPFAPVGFGGAQDLLDMVPAAVVTGPWRPLAPAVGLLVLAVLVSLVATVGHLLAMAAPFLLGPSAADRISAAQARADSLAERNRLARELHDSIGHALSVVTLHAGTAARLIDTDPRFARTALEAIADTARTATEELDHVLGLLRDERAATAPLRDLTDLPGLIDATGALGLHIDTAITGDLASVPAVVSRETYRVCQEGLTNAARHAGKVPISLTLAVGDERLRVEISNPRPARAPAPARRGGRGLDGMAERLRLLGGRLDVGAHGGVWRLRADIGWGSGR
ncbi:signal transduction histidine kinase [Murinocardiopsis flavida]|uniref:histidine kinase n=2 Tax=Murinocardiopsis flavida TaxID=645275 RepID=A0A2P8DNY9_9ACTN|nr:signal transduction histidine kinase [Murinocardiopsis flavida]